MNDDRLYSLWMGLHGNMAIYLFFFFTIYFQDQTVRLIYSYHPDDPSSETDLKYHGFERRGTKSVSLLSSSLPPPSIEHEDIKNYEFRTRNVSGKFYSRIHILRISCQLINETFIFH